MLNVTVRIEEEAKEPRTYSMDEMLAEPGVYQIKGYPGVRLVVTAWRIAFYCRVDSVLEPLCVDTWASDRFIKTNERLTMTFEPMKETE